MQEQELTLAQQREIEALYNELTTQLVRTKVDLGSVGKRLRESQPRVERRISDTETDVELAIDVSKIVRTLQQLPDAAGVEAFVAAYNAHL